MALDSLQLKKVLEALLFVTKKPLSFDDLSKVTEQSPEVLGQAIDELNHEYEPRGLKIVSVAHGYIMGTDISCAEYVDRLVNSKIEATLSPQALETLAIIAYKQPITKPEIESIRGLYSDGVLDTLVVKKLIEDKGRSLSVGRPILYGTTTEFLRHFGLKDLADLPPLPQAPIKQEDLFKTVLQ